MVTRKTTSEKELEAHQLLTHSINMLAERIEKTETDFVGHLKKVEDRLDQIVDLTKTVAVLQTQTTSQNELIAEVRTSQRDYASKNDASVTRIHTRIEEVQNHTRDKMELLSKEQELAIKEVRTKSDNNEKELKQWLNRGIGAWLVFVVVIGTINTSLWRWVDSLERDRATVSQSLETARRDHLLYDNKLQALDNNTKENNAAIKNLQQSQRELEDSVFRREKK